MNDERNLQYDYHPPTNPTESDILTNKEMQRAEAVLIAGDHYQQERLPKLQLIMDAYLKVVNMTESEGRTHLPPDLLHNAIESQIEKEEVQKWSIRNMIPKKDESRDNITDEYKIACVKQLLEDGLASIGLFKSFNGSGASMGLRRKRALNGLSYLYVGDSDKNKRYGMSTQVLNFDQVYYQQGVVDWQDMSRIVIRFFFPDYDDFRKHFEGVEGIEDIAWGEFGFSENDTINNESVLKDTVEARTGEVGLYIDRGTKQAVWFSHNYTEIMRFERDEYPYMKDNDAHFPVFNFQFSSITPEGPYPMGLGDILLRLSEVQGELDNEQICNIIQAGKGIPLIRTSDPDALWNSTITAIEEREQGLFPMIVDETSQGMQTSVDMVGGKTSGLDEQQYGSSLIDRKLGEKKISVSEAVPDSSITLGQAQQQASASSAKAKAVNALNTEVFQEALEVIIYQMIGNFNPKDKINTEEYFDVSKITIKAEVSPEGSDETANVEVGFDESGVGNHPTVSDVMQWAKNMENIIVEVDESTGVKENVALMMELLDTARRATEIPPQNQAQAKLQREVVSALGYEVSEEDLMPAPAPPQQQG